MTGREALDKLQAGYILRRKAWEPDEKCKAYFSDDMLSVKIDINNPILGALDTHLVPQWVPDKPEFSNYVCYYDIIDSGDLLEDDWEILN
jgi:hypothetical protein